MTQFDRRHLLTAAAVTAALVLAGCGTIPRAGGVDAPGADGSAPAGSSAPAGPTSEPSPTPDPVTLIANIKDGSKNVKVSTVAKVSADNGTLDKVKMTYKGRDTKGNTVKGTVDGRLAKDKTTWTADDRLEPAATYTLAIRGTNPEQEATTSKTSFTTKALTLSEQTFAQLTPLKGTQVGVGMPAILTFDLPVKNRKEFEKHLTVTSSPKQSGTWSWFSDKEVHFRPKSYWKPGTKVKVAADLNGLNAGNGIYGQNSTSTSFTVGRSLITKINLNSHRAKVYIDGDLERTIPISAGKSGWRTRSGTTLIMEKLPVTRMTNQMIGAAESYDLRVKYAMRITWSGEFIHAAPWNSGKFGSTNASHGCVGMSTANAAWLFKRVQIGDPVVTTGSNRGLERGNGYTDWDQSWSSYKKGSAL